MVRSFHWNSLITIGFVLLYITSGFGQDQRIADSLKIIYDKGDYPDSSKFEILRGLAFNEINNYDLALQYAEDLVYEATENGDLTFQAIGYLQKGRISRLTGDLDLALENLFKSVEAANKVNIPKLVGGAYITIADIYSINGNSKNALLYYNQSIQILRETTDSVTLASALLNIGDEYFNVENYDSALYYFNESGEIYRQINYPIGTAYNLGNLGMVYAEQGRDERALANINEAIKILEELQDYYPISVYLTYLSDIYIRKNNFQFALKYSKRSLELATSYGLKEQISEANFQLSKLYEQAGNLPESYKYYKNHIAFRDSVNNIETVQQMADLRTDFEVSKKQIEVDLLQKEAEIAELRSKRQKILIYSSVISLILVALLAFGALNRYKYIKKTNKIIKEEKDRSENLLLNILPEETARELMDNGEVTAKKFDSVTVLFSDFKEFTRLAEHSDPEKLVKSIDFYFKKFDEITDKYGLEKIKTIGDSYMCAGGLPTETITHAKNVIYAAREMLDEVLLEMEANDDLIHFQVRIGVHTGPVVAGIVGIKKWQYDIWGDTVNIASRMETNSESGRINISETTYNEIKDEFPCEFRGEIKVKNRGSMKMYFLS